MRPLYPSKNFYLHLLTQNGLMASHAEFVQSAFKNKTPSQNFKRVISSFLVVVGNLFRFCFLNP